MKKQPITAKKKKLDEEDKLLVAAGKYLETIGWIALTAGVDRVQMMPHQFELVIRFAGGRKTQ